MKLFVGAIQWASLSALLLIVLRTLTHLEGIDTAIPFIRWFNVVTSVLLSFCISYKMWFEPFRDEFVNSITRDIEETK